MGLTIHYTLKSRTRSADKAKALVEQMRQLALDLPFDAVDDQVQYIGPDVCQRPLDDLRNDGPVFSTVADAVEHVPIPWLRKRHGSVVVQPLEIMSFWTIPGPGSEWASIGLARYPAEIEVTYRPRVDDLFIRTVRDSGSTRWDFDWNKWQRWLVDNGFNRWDHPDEDRFREQRFIGTRLGGWRYSAFCKTQYASNVEHGGVPNFIKCHLCVIHLLDRIGTLPTMKVEVDDEGKYGRSYYTDDPWADLPVYTWHEGKYDVKALAEEVGEWNEMIAAQFGALNDALKASEQCLDGPITAFPDFEHLEFNGQQNVGPFLDAMKRLADQERMKRAV
jgi:hypothetical protein